MTKQQIMDLQRYVGAEPDGIWGSESIRKTQLHLRRLMPYRHPWPRSDAASLLAFYGQPGDESQLTSIDVSAFDMHYDGRRVERVSCHKRVAESLLRVYSDIQRNVPHELSRDFFANYFGCYNNRSVRGGSTPSLHARGAAVDHKALTNGNRAHWPANADMSVLVMECFCREGWLPAGAFWHRDAMHFQATQ